MPEARELVFVYGTLRRGGAHHFRLNGADLVSVGIVRGKIFRITWYPGLVLADEGEVRGEVYPVGRDLLLELDAFEGISAGEVEGSEYRRVKAPVFLSNGEPLVAWVWEWTGPVDEAKLVTGGDWLAIETGGP